MTNRVAGKGESAVFVSRYTVPAITALAEQLSPVSNAKASEAVDEEKGEEVTIKVEWCSP
ncbi:MAG: hypothetical protein JSV90_07390 [Methanobacteriota archaeon]|nr:MAG: hypothetical protein JSV90_07390 [Euryarchaeota archaeon]